MESVNFEAPLMTELRPETEQAEMKNGFSGNFSANTFTIPPPLYKELEIDSIEWVSSSQTDNELNNNNNLI